MHICLVTTYLGSTFKLSYIQNCAIMNCVIKRLLCICLLQCSRALNFASDNIMDLWWDCALLQNKKSKLFWRLLLLHENKYIKLSVFYLITAHTPIRTYSSNFVILRLQPMYLYLLFIKAYIVDTHLNGLDKSRQFKWVPTTYAFIKTIRVKYRVNIINNPLMKSSANLFFKLCPH